jgi:hypothetical protein
MIYDLNSYCDITKVVNDKLYANDKGIHVKQINCDDKPLYMLNYNKSKLTKENVSSLGLFRSVITDGVNILCFSPPKSMKMENFIENLDYKDVKIEEFVEGTMINLFCYNNTWLCSTKGTIHAKCKFFRDYPKTFRALFLEATESCKLEFSMLNPEYCYSFILQHPENRIVVPFSRKNLVLTNMYKCTNINVESIDLVNIPGVEISYAKTIANIYESYKGESFPDLFDYFSSQNIDYKNMGIVLNYDGKRSKIWNPNYLKVKSLRGNNPKIQFQYFHLLKDRKLMDFLKFYPEYNELFNKYKIDLFSWTDQLWKNYKSCYIRKERPLKNYSLQFRTHMYKIHEAYLNDLMPQNKKTDKLYTINYVKSLEPAQLMHSINFEYRNMNVDQQKANHEIVTGVSLE